MPYIKLMRLNKPVGIWLFLWPTLWALWLAAGGVPTFNILWVFVLGVVVMRSAGCVFNDFCDQKFDRAVRRTKDRPLARGEITSQKTIMLFLSLSVVAAYLAFQLNQLTLEIACVIFFLAILYPLTKRWFHIPQVFLGITVAGAVPMAFASIQNQLPSTLWWVYAAAFLWPVAYDTIYALVDRQDDTKIGVKSTAVLFGPYYQWVIGLLQFLFLGLLGVIGRVFSLHWPYYLSICIVLLYFFRQQWLIKNDNPEACFKAFSESHWVGFMVFLGIVGSFVLH
jgi:4-hydroxybenzoate polyprenyltransferase